MVGKTRNQARCVDGAGVEAGEGQVTAELPDVAAAVRACRGAVHV